MKFFIQGLLFISLIALSGCIPSVDIDLEQVLDGEVPTVTVSGVEIEPNIITSLRSGPLIDESLGSCILSDFSLNPQPYLVKGTPYLVKGTPYLVKGTPYLVKGTNNEILVNGIPALEPNALGQTFESILSGTDNTLNKDVALIVLDDFGNKTFDLNKVLFEVQDLSEELLVEYESQGLSSHGALVSNHINALMSGLGNYEPTRTAPDLVEWRNQNTGRRILVKAAVPTGFETDTVSVALQKAVADLRAQGIDKIVVNMSFIILPCSIVRDFVVQKVIYPSLFSYLANVVSDNVERILDEQGLPNSFNDEVARRVSETVVDSLKPVDPEGDPLRLAILANPDVVFVGAAGNFGRDVSAYPAAWEEVLAVSASDTTGKADFSNTGEVMFTGAWFRLTNPANLNGHGLTESSVVYSGTSFAAPGVSVFSALDLASSARCGLVNNRPRLSLLNQADVPLEKAVAEACQ